MYLITTLGEDWIIVKQGTRAQCQKALEKLKRKVWYNEDGTRKIFSCIFDSTRAKNAEIVTNATCAHRFGGRQNLEDYKEWVRQQESII